MGITILSILEITILCTLLFAKDKLSGIQIFFLISTFIGLGAWLGVIIKISKDVGIFF